MEICCYCGGEIPPPKASGVLRPVEIHPDLADCELILDAKRRGVEYSHPAKEDNDQDAIYYVLRQPPAVAESVLVFSSGSFQSQKEEYERILGDRYEFHGMTREGRAKK